HKFIETKIFHLGYYWIADAFNIASDDNNKAKFCQLIRNILQKFEIAVMNNYTDTIGVINLMNQGLSPLRYVNGHIDGTDLVETKPAIQKFAAIGQHQGDIVRVLYPQRQKTVGGLIAAGI